MKKLLLISFLFSLQSFSQNPYITEFASAWNGGGKTTATNYSNDPLPLGDGALGQSHYYIGWNFDGLVSAWRGSGNLTYLDDALTLVYNMMATAITLPNGYEGWTSVIGATTYSNGLSLYESYSWRHIATMLRVMYQSPTLLATSNGALTGTTYQDNYDDILPFLQTNLWNKWRDEGLPQFYRINTHVASHWARIGMELYIITGDTEYLDVFNNISYLGAPSMANAQMPEGANLRDQLFLHANGTSYQWSYDWDVTTPISDNSHGSDMVSFIVEAYENGMYWNLADINGFSSTLDDLIWSGNDPITFALNVDGSGGYTNAEASFAGWLALARYNDDLMTRALTHWTSYLDTASKRDYVMGTLLLAKATQDGTVVYPENPSAPPSILTPSEKNRGKSIKIKLTRTNF